MNASRSRAWYEVEAGEVDCFEFCGGTITHFSQRCPTRVSSPNEDAACVIEVNAQHGLLAVADGVGGANAGNQASLNIIKQLIKETRSTASENPASLRGKILDAIEKSNDEVLSWGIGAASTLVVVEFFAAKIRTFHVGDSKAMLLSNQGRIKFSTVGHAPIAMAVEIGVLNEEEGLLHEDRNLITNCVGSNEMKIEIGSPVPMATRDTLVVASDGLFDNLTTEEIASVIRIGNLAEQTSELAKMAISRMVGVMEGSDAPSKPDDLTIICFRQTQQAKKAGTKSRCQPITKAKSFGHLTFDRRTLRQ
ncbi:MAG: serine/threonine protein phosphatase PrpC [Mariniblastus sp.]|jgi:serine/threonine protein phosphatase PrpC